MSCMFEIVFGRECSRVSSRLGRSGSSRCAKLRLCNFRPAIFSRVSWCSPVFPFAAFPEHVERWVLTAGAQLQLPLEELHSTIALALALARHLGANGSATNERAIMATARASFALQEVWRARRETSGLGRHIGGRPGGRRLAGLRAFRANRDGEEQKHGNTAQSRRLSAVLFCPPRRFASAFDRRRAKGKHSRSSTLAKVQRE